MVGKLSASLSERGGQGRVYLRELGLAVQYIARDLEAGGGQGLSKEKV
jgi:hypothetical protein